MYVSTIHARKVMNFLLLMSNASTDLQMTSFKKGPRMNYLVPFTKKITSNCWLEHVQNSKKMPHKPNIFLIPLSISELNPSQNFFITVWPPGGANITFAENWNFKLNFFC